MDTEVHPEQSMNVDVACTPGEQLEEGERARTGTRGTGLSVASSVWPGELYVLRGGSKNEDPLPPTISYFQLWLHNRIIWGNLLKYTDA